MNKKLVVFASALLFGLFTLTSLQTTAATSVSFGIEATDDCGGENGKGCGTEAKGEAGEKKSCCSGGEAKSCSDKKGEKKETKTETKTEEKKK